MSTATRQTPAWVPETDVVRLVNLAETIELLRTAYALAAGGDAVAMPRAHAEWDGGLLHAVGGVLPAAGISGVKTWAWTPRGARPVVIVFSTEDGSVRGLVDAIALGQLRTAATAAIGTDYLAPSAAESVAILGTGRQALSQVLAVAAVRPICSVRVFGRDAERRTSFASRVAEEMTAEVSQHDRVEDAIDGAAIITTVTRAREPFLHGALLQPGVHINAVGAIVATSAELDSEAVRRADIIAVDSRVQAREDAGDLRAAARDGALNWDDVLELGQLGPNATTPGRTSTDQITLLRTLGLGIADVALADAVLQRFQNGALNNAEVGEDTNGVGHAT